MTLNGQNKTGVPLNGLVLVGGKSVRMGHDKGTIMWHNKEQRYYITDLLQTLCKDVFISCRKEQKEEIDSNYNLLTDTYTGKGPLGGILSAFEAQPETAWLVTACDLPLLDEATLDYLIGHRDEACIATTFKSPFDALPEPLITIWEPASLAILLTALAEGFTCPRKILIRNEARVKILTAPDEDALMNANTPEDAEKVRAILNRNKAVH